MSENIYMKLTEIQAAIKVQKTHLNDFAKKPFLYRNAEDILKAAKPVCKELGCVLLLSDEPKKVGDRYYIEATALLSDGESAITVTASAREAETRSGFDCAQITGSASSYARKYALNGLLGLDDSEDPDSKDNSHQDRRLVDGAPICPRCGREVMGYTGKSGQWYTPEDVINRFGMCCDCYREQKYDQ